MAPEEPRSEDGGTAGRTPAQATGAATVDLGIAGYADAVEIGRGGFAVVYRARRPAFDQIVAVKVLAMSGGDVEAARFDRERRAMGALAAHPNIVTVYESGLTAGGHPYLCMEYLPRGSAADRLSSGGPLAWASAVRIGIRLAGALETAHRAGVLHRDIKPENVLMSDFGEPQLADFGIARIVGGDETRSGSIAATLAYAPPEILRGQRPSVGSDVYSLGATLFTLLRGRYPFADETGEPSFARLLARIEAEPVQDLRPHGVPDAVCCVLERSMAKDPADRQGSAQELGAELQRAQSVAGLAVTALPVGPVHSEAVPSPPATEPASPASTGRPRRRAVTAVVAAVALIAVAAAAIVFGPFRHTTHELPVNASGVPTTAVPTTAVPAPAVVATIKVDPRPSAIAVGAGAVWIASNVANTVQRIDPATNQVTATIPVGISPVALAVVDQAIWVANAGGPTVMQLDAATGRVLTKVDLNGKPLSIAVGEGAVWVVDDFGPGVERIDLVTKAVTTIPLSGRTNGTVAVGNGAVWVSQSFDSEGGLRRIDPKSLRMESIRVGKSAARVAVGLGAVWVADGVEDTVTAVDPSTRMLAGTVKTGVGPVGMAFGKTDVWIANNSRSPGGDAIRLDAETKKVTARVPVGSRPSGIAISDNAVWVVDGDDSTVTRILGA